MKRKIAMLVSGKGTNLDHIYNACKLTKLNNFEVALVLADVWCGGINRASYLNIPNFILPLIKNKKHEGVIDLPYTSEEKRKEWDRLIVSLLNYFNIDLVCMAGFMKILGKDVIDAYEGRILNIHPGLLPTLAGKDPQRKALELGLLETGNTVHIATEKVDDNSYILATDRVYIDIEYETEESLSLKLKVSGYNTYIRGIKEWEKRQNMQMG